MLGPLQHLEPNVRTFICGVYFGVQSGVQSGVHHHTVFTLRGGRRLDTRKLYRRFDMWNIFWGTSPTFKS